MELPTGTKRYGYSGLAAVGMQFAPGIQAQPGDPEWVAVFKILAQVAPVVLPVIMDGCEKMLKAMGEAFAAFHATKSEAVKIVEAAKAKVEGP